MRGSPRARLAGRVCGGLLVGQSSSGADSIAVCAKKKVVGVDIVEVSLLKGTPITEFNAAKLVYRLMGYLA